MSHVTGKAVSRLRVFECVSEHGRQVCVRVETDAIIMHTQTGKVVTFNMYVGSALSEHDAATAGDATPLIRLLLYTSTKRQHERA